MTVKQNITHKCDAEGCTSVDIELVHMYPGIHLLCSGAPAGWHRVETSLSLSVDTSYKDIEIKYFCPKHIVDVEITIKDVPK